jgi:sulfur-carrier protein
MITVRIPPNLRSITGQREEIPVSAATIRTAIAALEKAHPGIADRLFDERGELRRFVLLFLNDTRIEELAGLETPVASGDELSIVPALSGG